MNCKYLKIKLNRKLECKLQKQIISIDQCKDCILKEYNKSYNTLNNRSKTLNRLERQRTSVIVSNDKKCSICGSFYSHLDKDEIFGGRNRQNSMKYGFILYLCRDCHIKKTNDEKLALKFKKEAQKYFEKNIGSREEFIKIFGKNYL